MNLKYFKEEMSDHNKTLYCHLTCISFQHLVLNEIPPKLLRGNPCLQQGLWRERTVTQFSDLIVQDYSSMKLPPSCRAIPFACQVKAQKFDIYCDYHCWPNQSLLESELSFSVWSTEAVKGEKGVWVFLKSQT